MNTVIEKLKQVYGGRLNAALYARFSSDNQREESIDAQIRAINTFAETEGVNIVRMYIDRAKSATTDDRPEFQKMIKESAEGAFDVVLVHKLDRFSRNRVDSSYYKLQLRKNGVRIVSVLEQLDDESPESVILESVLEGLAEFYSKNLAREVKKGLKENAMKCQHTGGLPPLGYDVDPISRKLVINQHEAEAVKIIFEMTADGYVYSDIMIKLNSMGYKTKLGKEFGKNSLFDILRNPKYKGDYVFNRSASRDPITKKRNNHRNSSPENMIVIPNGVPAIISTDLFEQVQKILANRKNMPRPKKHSGEKYLLTGKIFCGECGCRYIGNSKHSDKYRKNTVTYRCNNRKRRAVSGCTNSEINRDYIEAFVLDKIEKTIFNEEIFVAVMKQVREYYRQQTTEQQRVMLRLQAELAECDKKQKNITDLLISGVSTVQRDILLRRAEELEQQRMALIESVNHEKLNTGVIGPSESDMRKCLEKVRAMFKDKTLPNIKQLIDMVVEKIIINKDEVQVFMNLVFLCSKDCRAGILILRKRRKALRNLRKAILSKYRSLLLQMSLVDCIMKSNEK